MNNSGEVYVSSNAMYLYHSDWSASRELTKISKISFEDGVMKTGETTSVNGYLNDKFAIMSREGICMCFQPQIPAASLSIRFMCWIRI